MLRDWSPASLKAIYRDDCDNLIIDHILDKVALVLIFLGVIMVCVYVEEWPYF